MQDFSGKTALVTGGGSGIGRALALALAAEGARVVIGDIILDNAQAVATEIAEKGGEALAVHCDVCDREAIKRMKTEANEAFGRVSLLFANAGATSFERLVDMTADNLDWICQVNLMGVTNCIAAFLPDMLAAGEGHIVATASAAGLNPGWIPYHVSYSGAKMGIIGTVLNLRHEIAEQGVGATVLIPFGVETGMKDHNESYRPARFGGPRQEAVVVPEGSFKEIKLHFRQPEEVAPMVLRAVHRNQPMVVTDASQRHVFQETYVDLVMSAFDEAEAYDREHT
ncbi:MAG TPA: SDR family oxidoreductase [Pseudomonadaceae bacterium]|nr:SDR family oxidoreductase [Pseudomonadaceae bacterium]